MIRIVAAFLLASASCVAPFVFAAAAAPTASSTQWSLWGGEAAFRWNEDLLRVLGIELTGIHASDADEYGYRKLAVREQAALRLAVRHGRFEGFTGGSLALQGGFELRGKHAMVSLRSLRLEPRAGAPLLLDVLGEDGTAWFFVDRLMYDLQRGKAPMLDIRTMDLRIGQAFADWLGDPSMLGHSIADVALRAHIHASDGDYAALAAKRDSSKWPGYPAPDGSTYQADVLMQSFTTVWKRQSSLAVNGVAADGPGGANGLVVYAPSSTLRNNRNAGSPVQTVNDPLGTSQAVWAADIAWYEKFSGSHEPYRNDQHPYLIWNLYRIDAQGRLVQVARSGVKHAFLTVNQECDEDPGSGQILGLGCSDTYSDGNNDAIAHLGPRSEIVPATAQWGRCGSVYDRDCNGVRDAGSPCSNVGGGSCSNWAFRMPVHEEDIQASTNAGAIYRMESWYLIRDDIDIFNTMQTRPVSFTWNAGNGLWQIANSPGLALGPAIDRWVPRDSMTASQSSASIAEPDGHARVAVKVADLGDGQYRYTYAVMNFDFARAVTQGVEPNLRVLSNDGFTALRIPRGAGVGISAPAWFDGDGGDWTLQVAGDGYTWNAPAGNALSWGSLYTFSFVANASPVASMVRLTTAPGTGMARDIEVPALVPGSTGDFAIGGTVAGVAGSDGVQLQLDADAPIVRSADGPYEFALGRADGASYRVAIVRHPTGRHCTLANAEGTVLGANVVNVDVQCSISPPPRASVGGTVQGLASGRSVSLSLDGAAPITRDADGPFVFPTDAAVGAAYSVQVAAQPVAQQCTLGHGSGVVPPAGVDDIRVDCADLPPTQYSVNVRLQGLAAERAIVLQLNGAGDLQLAQDGMYAFDALLPDGRDYAIGVSQMPQGQHCSVANGSGTIAGADVDDALVTCIAAPLSYPIGGMVAGLGAGHSVTLSLDGAQTLVREANGAFAFAQVVPDGAHYMVSVTAASGAACVVTDGSGTVQGAAVTDVAVDCGAGFTRFEDGFEDE